MADPQKPDKSNHSPSFENEEHQLAYDLLSDQVGPSTALDIVDQQQTRSYNAIYKGAEPVAAATIGSALWSIVGSQVVANTAKKLKKHKTEDRRVIITISTSGLKLEDDTEIFAFESLSSIEHVCLDQSDAKRVAYLANYPRLGLLYCHIVKFGDKSRAIRFMDHIAKLRTLINHKSFATLGTTSVIDNDLDDQTFGFEDECEVATDIRNKIATLYGATVAIAELDYIGSTPLSQVDLADAFKDQCNHLQVIIDKYIDHLQKENGGLAKVLLHRRSSIRRVKNKQARHVILIASMEGIRVVDSRSKEEFLYHYIKDVKLYGQVKFGKVDCAFAFVTCDAHLQSISCHMFFARTDQDVRELTSNVGKATEACEEMDELQHGQPFMPVARTKGKLTGPLAQLEVNREEIAPIRPIGAGQFGVVFEVAQKLPGIEEPQTRAVKALRQGASRVHMIDFIREAEILAELCHHNIVRLEAVCLQQQPWLLVEELVTYGDLDYVLHVGLERHVYITLQEVLYYSLQILDGLIYLLDNRYLHLDIAARNMLLGSRNEVKISDFGMCRRLAEGKSSIVVKDLPKVAARWLAVEALDQHRLSEKSDVWAFGVTVWEILMQGKKPYDNIHFLQVAREIRQGHRLEKPDNCPDTVWDIIIRCWHKKPERRPSFRDLQHMLTAKQHELDTGIDRDLGKLIFSRTMTRHAK